MARDLRRIVTFACAGDHLFATVDEGLGTTGVLIASGGNEVRCGAHRGMALLAGKLSAAGIPVFRFDRRGVGDSEGENRGYAAFGPDIAAALAAFRDEQPQLTRIVGFGNCDAATALALIDRQCDGLVLANPWLGDENAALPPAAVRAHYARKLLDPLTWRAFLTGGVATKLRSLRAAFGAVVEQPLARRMATAIASRPTTIVLAMHDRTAQVFAAGVDLPANVDLVRIDTASHSFAGRIDALADTIGAAVSLFDRKDHA